MSILSTILKNTEARPPVFTPTPVAATGTALNPPQQPEGPELKPMETTPTNRWDYDPATMEHLKSQGYTEDELNQTVGMYDPANYGTPNRQWYEANVSAPVAPDEKQIKRAKIWASVGDALGLLAQSFAAGRGAHVTARPYDTSALAQTRNREQQLRDAFQQQWYRYQTGLADAGFRDITRGQDQHNRDRAELRDVLAAKQRLDQQQAQFEAKQEAAAEAARMKQEQWEAEFGETQGRNRAYKSAQYASADASRALAEQRRAGGGDSGEQGKASQIMLKANANDPEAQTDSFGNRYVMRDVTPEQRAAYLQMALADKAFKTQASYLGFAAWPTEREIEMAKRDGKSISIPNISDAQADRIIDAYAQYRYDKQFNNATAAPQWYSGYRAPWEQGVNAVEDEDDQYLEE